MVPGAPQSGRFFENFEVLETGPAQMDCHAQAAGACPDDHDAQITFFCRFRHVDCSPFTKVLSPQRT